MKIKPIRVFLLMLPLLFAREMSNSQPVELFVKNSEAAIQKQDYDNALKWMDSALVLSPRNASLLIQRANVLILQEFFPEAITEVEIALDLDSNLAAAYGIRAKARLGIGNWSEAMVKEVVADFNRSVSLEPNNYMLYVQRSDGYLEMRKVAEAEADLTKAIELEPTLADLYFRRGKVRSRRGYGFPEQYDKAHEDFTKAIGLSPKEPDYYAQRAVNSWYKLIKNPTEPYPKFDGKDPLILSIKADIKQALKINPTHWLALAYRGETTYKINWNQGKNSDKDRYQSIDDLLASLKANPKNNPARSFLERISMVDYPSEKLAAALEAALAYEKAYFEKNILRLTGTESLASFSLASQQSALKSNPQFDIGAYLNILAASNPGNLCYQLHNDRHRYNWSFEMKEQKFSEVLSKPFDEKYNQCAYEMAMDLARHYRYKIFNAESPESAKTAYASARKWVEKADSIYPGSASYLAVEIEEVKTKKDDYLAKNYKPPTQASGSNSRPLRASASPAENLLIDEYNRLVAYNIPHLQGLQKSLQGSVSDYMRTNQMARVWMHRKIYNQCSGVINSHEAFITSLNNLLKRSYGVAPSLVPEINSQIRSIESAVNRLRDVRYGLVSVL